MKIRLACPVCECNGAVQVQGAARWTCPACEHVVNLTEPARTVTPTPVRVQPRWRAALARWYQALTKTTETVTLHQCAACGSKDLFKKKAFPHWLGMSLLAFACVAFLVLNYYRLQWWGWGILIGSALLDGALYLLVSDEVVCYQCEACHGGIGRSGNAPFELTIQERYRQMKLRQAALSAPGPRSSPS